MADFRLHGKLAYMCSGLDCSRYWACESEPPSEADLERSKRDHWIGAAGKWFCSFRCLSSVANKAQAYSEGK